MNQGMTHNSSLGNKHPGSLLNGISEEGQDTSVYQSKPFIAWPWHHLATRALTAILAALGACRALSAHSLLDGIGNVYCAMTGLYSQELRTHVCSSAQHPVSSA